MGGLCSKSAGLAKYWARMVRSGGATRASVEKGGSFSPSFASLGIQRAMRLLRNLAILVCWLSWFVLSGCSPSGAPPDLLQVVAVQPREVSSGDELEIVGTNFPEGKPATISFVGSLHRPGQQPKHDVEIVVAATSASRQRIVALLDDITLGELAGRGAEASHTTFRGRVIAAFAPKLSGAPPVTGSLEGVEVDFYPPDNPQSPLKRLEEEGERARAFFGLELDIRPGVAGLLVKQVATNSRAESSGVRVGDRLLALDGVRLYEISDFVPSGKAAYADLELSRGRLREVLHRRLDVEGFRDTPPEDLLWAGVAVGVVCISLLAFLLPAASVVGWFERRVVERMRLVSQNARRLGLLGWSRKLLAAIFQEEVVPGASAHALGRVVPYLMFLGASALFTVLSFGHALVEPELDLGIIFLGTVTALACTGLMLGGWRPRGRWSLRGGIGAALQSLCYQIPPLAGIAVIVLQSGSVRIDDIVAVQGGAPWEWYLFKSPITCLMFLLFLVPALSEGSRAHAELPELDFDPIQATAKAGQGAPPSGVPSLPRFRSVRSRYLMFFAEWGQVFVMSGLAAALFLGGWQLPGVSKAAMQADLQLSLLGALLFNLKAWGLSLVVLWVRWALPRIRVDQLIGVCFKWFVPLAVLGFLANLGWQFALGNPLFYVLQLGTSYVLFGFVMLIPVYLLARVAISLRRRRVDLSLNPWI